MPARLHPRPVRLVLPKTKPLAAALVINSWWGLTASFTDYADRLADKGIAVGLSDLFDGQTATTQSQAQALRKAPRSQPIYVGLQHDMADLIAATGLAQVSVIGFSMGAHWAVWLSQQPGNPIRKAVLYYGARGGNFAASQSSYLAHFAAKDPWVSATSRRGMERALSNAKRPFTAHDYPGTGHWFAESAKSDSYEKAAADQAFARSCAHITGP